LEYDTIYFDHATFDPLFLLLMFYLEEREKRFFSILLRIFFASTFIYVPGMVLLPIAAIAAISLSLSIRMRSKK